MSVDLSALAVTANGRIKTSTSAVLGRFGFLNYVKPIIQPAGVTTTKVGASVSSNMWTSGNNGSPTPVDIESMAGSVTPIPFEVSKKVELGDATTYADQVAGAVDDFLNGFYSTMEELWGTSVLGADAFTHPASGEAYVFPFGGSAGDASFYADNVTIDPVSGAANFNQTNLYSATIGSSTLESMCAARLNARDFSGDRAPRPIGKGLLFANTSLGMQGESHLARTNEGLDGAGAQLLAGFGDRLMGPVHIDSKVTGANVVWGAMWSRPATLFGGEYDLYPVHPVVKEGLSIRIERSTNSNHIYVLGYAKLGILFHPFQYDLQISIA